MGEHSAVSAPYDRLAPGYDSTRRADPYLAARCIELLQIEPAGLYLDLACGTGNYTAALAAAGARICGVDRSAAMVARAQPKSGTVRWCVALAGALPFRNGLFAGALCTLAIHHFASLEPAFREVFRALGRGRFVIFTAAREQMRGYWLNEYFPEAMGNAIAQMPEVEAVVGELRSCGFGGIHAEPYAVRPGLRDFFLYAGKERPALYLDPQVRAGISYFSMLASPAEVAQGCRRLAADIESGRIEQVRAAYRHDRGDYLFVVADKA